MWSGTDCPLGGALDAEPQHRTASPDSWTREDQQRDFRRGHSTKRRGAQMTEHNLFYYPYASFTNEQLPLLKVTALYFDKLTILDPVGASWATVGADHVARDAITLLKDAGILEVVTPTDVLAK